MKQTDLGDILRSIVDLSWTRIPSSQCFLIQMNNVLNSDSLINDVFETTNQLSRIVNSLMLPEPYITIHNCLKDMQEHSLQVEQLSSITNLWANTITLGVMNQQFALDRSGIQSLFPRRDGFLKHTLGLSSPECVALNGLFEGIKRGDSKNVSLERTFAGRFISEGISILSDNSERELESIVHEMLETVVLKAKQWSPEPLRSTSLTKYIMIALALANLFLTLRSIEGSDRTNELLEESILHQIETNEQLSIISENLLEESGCTNEPTLSVNQPAIFRTIAYRHCRNNPNSKAEVIADIPANALLVELSSQGQWYHVQFVDDTTGEMQRGWVHRNKLVRITWTQDTTTEDSVE